MLVRFGWLWTMKSSACAFEEETDGVRQLDVAVKF